MRFEELFQHTNKENKQFQSKNAASFTYLVHRKIRQLFSL